MAYRLTRQAEQDFYDIYAEGARQFGEAQADKYVSGLLETLSLLDGHPQMARERTEVTPPVRVHPYQAHLIIYTVQAEDILVLLLPSSSRDWQRLLAF